jgi:hypothetical protein
MHSHIRNPDTGRLIQVGGRTYNDLVNKYMRLNPQKGGGAIKKRYANLPASDKKAIIEWITTNVFPYETTDDESLYDVLNWLDQNVGLRFDKYTIEEMLEMYHNEIKEYLEERSSSQKGGGAIEKRYANLPASDKKAIKKWITTVFPYETTDESLYDVLNWLDQNVGLRFDKYTIEEMLEMYHNEIKDYLEGQIYYTQ